MHIEFPIEMEPQARPSNVSAFQVEEFDPIQFDSVKVKQVQGAIDSIKIIHSCLKAYFDGQAYMYKPIAAQLRILFCDTHRNKDHSLINRIHPHIQLLALKSLDFENKGPVGLAIAPYVFTEFSDGVVDAKLDIAVPYCYFPLHQWRLQLIELQPRITLSDVIRSVADQDGGAHFDDNESSKLIILKGHNPTNHGSNILFVIALAHYVIDFANQIVPQWLRNSDISI